MPLDHPAGPRTAAGILIVEPEREYRDYVVRLLDPSENIIVRAVADFVTARRCLEQMRPELLITNLRLGAYNGINLALLADRRHMTSIVYALTHDAGSARDVQQAGAFYELLDVLPMVLPDYLRQIASDRTRRHSEPGTRS